MIDTFKVNDRVNIKEEYIDHTNLDNCIYVITEYHTHGLVRLNVGCKINSYMLNKAKITNVSKLVDNLI